MSRIINPSEVEDSLNRAAKLAVMGTREERSGQSGGGAANVAMRLRNELRIAPLDWATGPRD